MRKVIRAAVNSLKEMAGDWPGRFLLFVLSLVVAMVITVGVAIYQEVDSWSLHRGAVISKNYHPAWLQPVVTGKSTVIIFHPEYWSITIEGVDDSGEHKTREISVDRVQWAQLQYGEQYEVK